jgi:hypothetical protein
MELQDSYVTCGPEYLNVRNTLRDAFYLGDFSKLDSKKNDIVLDMLAVFKIISLSDKGIENHGKKCTDSFKVLAKNHEKHRVFIVC